MGAVTALRYASTDNRISCLLCDSPFSDLRKLALEFAKEHSKVPSFLVKGALTFVRRSIRKRAHFNIKDLDQTKLVKNCSMPIIFISSKEDNFVKSWHTEKLFDLYAGEKKLIYMKGDHNAPRPKEFYKESANYFKENLENKHMKVHLENAKLFHNLIDKTSFMDEIINKYDRKISSEINEKKRYSSIERNNNFEENSEKDIDSNEEDWDERRKSQDQKRGKKIFENINDGGLKFNGIHLKKGKEVALPEKKKIDLELYKDPFQERNNIILTKK